MNRLLRKAKNTKFKTSRTLENPQPYMQTPSMVEIAMLPNQGLYHALDDIPQVADDTFKKRNIAYLAQFADYVTRGSLEQPWFAERHVKLQHTLEVIKNLNGTGVGNLAYIILHSDNEDMKKRAMIIINIWKST